MMSKMKKIYFCVFLVFLICEKVLSQSSLPECEGNDKNISKYSRKHFSKMRKWTNCYGTGMGPKGQKYIGEFYKGEYSDTKVENTSGNIKIIKDTDKEPIHMLTEINMLESGKNINIMEKALTYTLMETNILENGKKINILPQIT